jgi:hypothetical protein
MGTGKSRRPDDPGDRRGTLSKGVVLTVSGATALTGGGLLALGMAATAGAQTPGDPVDPGGISLVHQWAGVDNLGAGIANSGINLGVGNASTNRVGVEQVAGFGGLGPVVADGQAAAAADLVGPGPGGSGPVQANGTASNNSGGGATITTGAASATGNQSQTTVGQTAPAGDPNGINVSHQAAEVGNAGLGLANSGVNAAVGNASSNGAGVVQVVPHPGSATSLTGNASNTSGGTASITTGAASATGNNSSTTITQG